MIRKIVAVANVGRLSNYTGRGNVSFGKLTLIYGENGRGKTTLAAIFRSLCTGSPHHIAERQTLAGSGPPEVSILIEGGLATFSGGAWNRQFPHIEIFDAAFVHANVYEGDCVDHEHKKNLYRVIVGEEGVTLARAVDDLDGLIRTVTKEIGERGQLLAAEAPPGMDLDEFLSLSEDRDIGAKLLAKEAEVAALKRSSDIRTRSFLHPLSPPVLPENFLSLLATDVEDLAGDAERQVRTHMQRCMDQRGESWLAQGLTYAQSGSCPFCGQNLDGSALLTAYQSYFSARYRELKRQIDALHADVASRFSEQTLLQMQETVSSNRQLSEFWKDFVPLSPPDVPFQELLSAFQGQRAAAQRCIARKIASPLDAISPEPAFSDACAAYGRACKAVEAYNAGVAQANALVTEVKAATEGTRLKEAMKEADRLAAVRHRYTPAIARACHEYDEARRKKKQLEREKKTAKKKLDDYTKDILQRYQDRLNELLALFNAGFRIGNTKTRYAGGTPSSSYEIVINDEPVDLGDAKTPPGVPCFKTALSSGDRSTLALALFLVRLDHDPQLHEKILVFDDPITSQDGFRATHTQQLICRLCGGAKQVVVMSHDPSFLRRIWEETAAERTVALQLRRAAEDSVLTEWDIEGETCGEYIRNYYVLTRYAKNGLAADLRHVASCIRLVIEEYLRMKCPDQFPRTDTLGGFIRKIREAPPGTPLAMAQPLLGDLDDLNGYSRRYHHRDNPGFATEPITDTELQAYVRRTLALLSKF